MKTFKIIGKIILVIAIGFGIFSFAYEVLSIAWDEINSLTKIGVIGMAVLAYMSIIESSFKYKI